MVLKANSGEKKPRYDLIPIEALKSLGTTFALGAEVYGEGNWENGDRDFIKNRINHAIEHLYQFLKGDTNEDHLGHAMCNLAMLKALDERKRDTKRD